MAMINTGYVYITPQLNILSMRYPHVMRGAIDVSSLSDASSAQTSFGIRYGDGTQRRLLGSDLDDVFVKFQVIEDELQESYNRNRPKEAWEFHH